MGQKQTVRLTQKQSPSLKLDVIDMLSVVQDAEHLAEELVIKHNGDMEQIEKEILLIPVPETISRKSDFNFREEVLWAARWIQWFKKEKEKEKF